MLIGIPLNKVVPVKPDSCPSTPGNPRVSAAESGVELYRAGFSRHRFRQSTDIAATDTATTDDMAAAVLSESGPRALVWLRAVIAAMVRGSLIITLACVSLAANAGSVSATDVQQSEQNTVSGATVNAPDAEEPVSNEVLWKRAIDRDDTDAIRRLLSVVDVKLTNDKGKTALMAAAKTGELDLLETLLGLGLQLDDRSFTGGTSLMYAALGQQYAMIHHLLNAKRGDSDFQTYVDAASTNGWTAVMIAAAKGFDGVLQQLVEEGGADVWLADAYQWTPLMRAIDNRHTAVVQYLLSLDQPALNRTNENGATALHVAVERGDVATVRQLLARNIDPDIRDSAQRTARDIAISRNDKSMLEALSG